VHGLVDLTCALLSARSDAKVIAALRRTYTQAFQCMPVEASEPLDRACVQRAIQDCCLRLSVRPYRTAELQASAAKYCEESSSASAVLERMCPLIVACALRLDPTPALRNPAPKRESST